MDTQSSTKPSLLSELVEYWPYLTVDEQIESAWEVLNIVWGRMSGWKRLLIVATTLFLLIGVVLLFLSTIYAPGDAGAAARVGWAFLAGALFTLAFFTLIKK